MSGPGAYLFGKEERQEVMDVLESGYLARHGLDSDPNFKKKAFTLEKEFAEYVGVRHAIALNSGTSALLSCLAALGIGPGDEVIVPGYTFVASISSIVYSRAIPVFAEIDESLTIDPEDIKKKITKNTKAIIPVHMLGNPCNMDAIMKIAREHNLYVIEDACQAGGGAYKGKNLGTIGDMAAFSLNVFKTITCGEGGILVTNNDEYYERAFAFHDQGHKPFRKGVEIGHRSFMGLNYRITELNAAVALAQVRKLKTIVDILREKKSKLKGMLKDVDGIRFRTINDEKGECATLLTILFETSETANAFAQEIGSLTLSNSGWHVYNNMEHVLGQKMPAGIKCPFECPYYGKHIQYSNNMLPKTDDILSRAVNISVGVVDKGIGAPYGITILSSDEEIEKTAEEIKTKLKKALQH